jgi:hypothetical protein
VIVIAFSRAVTIVPDQGMVAAADKMRGFFPFDCAQGQNDKIIPWSITFCEMLQV